MGYNDFDVLEMLEELNTHIIISSKRSPYIFEEKEIDGKFIWVPEYSPGGLVNVLGPIVNLLRKGQWGKTGPYDLNWISENPEKEARITRCDVPAGEKNDDRYTLVRLYPTDFRYADFIWRLRHNIRRKIDINPSTSKPTHKLEFIRTNRDFGYAVVDEQRKQIPAANDPLSLNNDYQLPFATYFTKQKAESLRP